MFQHHKQEITPLQEGEFSHSLFSGENYLYIDTFLFFEAGGGDGEAAGNNVNIRRREENRVA